MYLIAFRDSHNDLEVDDCCLCSGHAAISCRRVSQVRHPLSRSLLNLTHRKVVESTDGFRKASACPSRRPGQVGWNGFSRRILPELDRISHLPVEQRRFHNPYTVNSSLTRLPQMSYQEQSDRLAGTIGLLKQSVSSRGPSPNRTNHFADTLHVQAGRSLKMQHRFSVEGPLR